MNTPSPTLTVRVSAIRSQNPYGRGGAIFTGIEVDSQGWRTDAKKHYVIKASNQLLLACIERGQLWRISGTPEDNTIFVNGYKLTEATIIAETMEFLRPSGEHIVTLLSDGEAFAGIGQVKARRLWDHFGQELYAVLDLGDAERLCEVLPRPMATKLVVAWFTWGSSFTLQWLQSKGFPVPLGRKVLVFYGQDAATRIEEDPYRLVSFAASWHTVDALAQETFHIAPDDPRRLAGAVEESLYSAFDAGHTCLSRADFKRRLTGLLNGLEADSFDSVVETGELRGSFIARNECLHAPGPYLMECTVAQAIMQRVMNPAPLLGEHELGALIDAYESEVRVAAGDPKFQLNDKQRQAVQLANDNPFAVITGGAGTGKTTALRALFRMYETTGCTIYAMALSGRAAKRIGEATGHKAQTIAGFLKHFSAEDAPAKGIVVIDEASMVDLPSVYRVVRSLPLQYRVVLVGDPHQLPPVGPGLLLHELAHGTDIPLVELAEVRRYGGEIAVAAASIRAGEWPELTNDAHASIAFLPCAAGEINTTVLRLYDEDRSASQILCATRNSLAGGVKPINVQCQQGFNTEGEELLLWNVEFEQPQGTGLRVGDPVICLKNDWEVDLQNGSLGLILSVKSQRRGDDPERCLGQVRWDDGQVRDLTPDLLPHLELAYAITIHKSQGSGFKRVIIPVTHNKLLDRSLLYTAVTRAEQQVILVGDVDAARKAVLAPRRSDARQVALRSLLQERLAAQLMANVQPTMD